MLPPLSRAQLLIPLSFASLTTVSCTWLSASAIMQGLSPLFVCIPLMHLVTPGLMSPPHLLTSVPRVVARIVGLLPIIARLVTLLFGLCVSLLWCRRLPSVRLHLLRVVHCLMPFCRSELFVPTPESFAFIVLFSVLDVLLERFVLSVARNALPPNSAPVVLRLFTIVLTVPLVQALIKVRTVPLVLLETVPVTVGQVLWNVRPFIRWCI